MENRTNPEKNREVNNNDYDANKKKFFTIPYLSKVSEKFKKLAYIHWFWYSLFDWDNIKILDTEQSLMKRRISEMIHIKGQISGINKQSDTEGLPDIYFPLLKKDLSFF